MALKLITLKTNHTILGDVEEFELGATIKYPVQVVSVPPQGPNEPSSIAFSPFVEYAEEFRSGFTINYRNILMVSTPVKELMNQYSKIFGSGIQIATSIPKL
jgi:hypothetical protein